MAQIEFSYNNISMIIQCNLDEKLIDIAKRFSIKINVDISKVYFLYSGKKIITDLTFEQIANNFDKERKKMNILILDNEEQKNNAIIQSKQIICPKCGESARFKIKDYKIIFYDCKNKHNIDNILLEEYKDTQIIDESKITCDI